ncbi:hypothetical protein J3Q64DRAFT_1246551 [Phycomyces blakesleeanus]|uniref:PH domain-containing protein n=1 Tax=Phycomyces blakesleeanus TaxID=4837 RepID=A0ABR3ARY6_PHYBL
MSEDISPSLSKADFHKIKCADRVFIGPWDANATQLDIFSVLPQPFSPIEPTTFPNCDISSTRSEHEIASNLENPVESTNLDSSSASPTSQLSHAGSPSSSHPTSSNDQTRHVNQTPSSSHDSFFTAYSEAVSTFEKHSEIENSDDEIDFDILRNNPEPLNSPHASSISASSALSIPTIRPPPTSQIALVDEEMEPSIPEPLSQERLSVQPQLKKKRSLVDRLTIAPKKLLWHKAGGVFVPTMPEVPANRNPAQFPGQPIKHGVMLCMKTVSYKNGSEPTRYRATKEARLGMFKGNWRQLETVLTSDGITTYSNSLLHWPKRYEEYKIGFSDKDRPPKLRLSLVSPLDYTFCLRYESKSDGEYSSVTFRARTLTLCQEWYMAIYCLLPEVCKTACPLFCEVYVPEIDIRIHLPLILDENRLVPCYDITAENVKDVLLAMIHEDQAWANSINEQLGGGMFGLCWTRKDRAEWIYWKNNVDNDSRRDVVICPQSIEKTHQLELRRVEHTPHDVILAGDMSLKEPQPIEGFLTRLTDYYGREIKNRQLIRRRYYISSFDQYLFYTKPNKVTVADPKCFVNDREVVLTKKPCPYIGLISPYGELGSDLEANERKRRMQLMDLASGLIDLTEVAYVRRAFSADFTQSGISESGSFGATSTTPVLHRIQSDQPIYPPKRRDDDIGYLEIVMNSGVIIKYEAFSNETCDAWVHQLAKLIVYWKALKEAERDVHARNNFYNGLNHHMQLALEENPVQLPKDKNCLVDTRIWSLCAFEQCRDVMVRTIFKIH